MIWTENSDFIFIKCVWIFEIDIHMCIWKFFLFWVKSEFLINDILMFAGRYNISRSSISKLCRSFKEGNTYKCPGCPGNPWIGWSMQAFEVSLILIGFDGVMDLLQENGYICINLKKESSKHVGQISIFFFCIMTHQLILYKYVILMCIWLVDMYQLFCISHLFIQYLVWISWSGKLYAVSIS